MNRVRFVSIVIAIGLMVSTAAFADSASHNVSVRISEITLIAINGGDVNLEVTGPVNPGDVATAGDPDSSTRLFYTSLVSDGGYNKITVGAGGDPVPDGTTLSVEASSISATGAGGVAQGAVQVNDIYLSEQDLVRDIGSAYTGTDPATSGAVLTYTLGFGDFTNLRAFSGAANIDVTYTITQQ